MMTRELQKKEAKKKETAGVLDKALLVITVLEETNGNIGLTKIADLAGINKTSCYRIINSLLAADLVEVGNKKGTYRLGMRFLKLGMNVQKRLNVRKIALPILTRLTEQTGDTTFLCLLNNLKAVCLERVEGNGVQVLSLDVGDVWPLYSGAGPRAILANLEIEKVTQALVLKIDNTQKDESVDYNEVVKEIRKSGYAVSFEDVTVGVFSIGAPIFNYEGDVIGSISLSSTVKSLPEEKEKEIAQLVKNAAKEVSEMMGWTE